MVSARVVLRAMWRIEQSLEVTTDVGTTRLQNRQCGGDDERAWSGCPGVQIFGSVDRA